MTSTGLFEHRNDAKNDALHLNKLLAEFNYIKKDIDTINRMEISEEAKAPAIAELNKQIADIKERMHNAIDEM